MAKPRYWWVRWDLSNFSAAAAARQSKRQNYLGFDIPDTPVQEDSIRFEVDRHDPNPLGDFVYTGDPGVLPCTTRGMKFLLRMECGRRRIYKGKIGSEDLYIFCPLVEKDALDIRGSRVQKYAGEDAIKSISAMRFNEYFRTDLDVFRLSNEERPRYEIIVSERFRDFYRKELLKGLLFRHIE